MSAGPTRRSLLATSALAAAGLAAPEFGLAACAPRPTAPQKPLPDVVLVRKMITEKDALIAQYIAVRDASPALAETLMPFLEHHQAHVAELRRRLIEPPASPRPPATPSAVATVPQPAETEAGAVASLQSAERAAAALHVKQIRTAPPALAQLVASIAACEASHAVALMGVQ